MKNLKRTSKSLLGKVSAVLLITTVIFVGCQKVNYDDANGVVEEKCESIGELNVIQNSEQVWEVQNNGQTLYHFPNEMEAYQTKAVLEYYNVSEACSCGEGKYTTAQGKEDASAKIMQYQKTARGSGLGDNEINSYANGVEDCLPFDPTKLVAKNVDGNWTIVEQPNHLMFSFGDDRQACIDALTLIKKYGYNQTCYIGRANASFNYLKRYDATTDPIPNL